MTADEIKKQIGSEKLIIGTDRVLKYLRQNKMAKVFLSSNQDKNAENDIRHFAGINKVEVEQLDMPNDDLGAFCKKPFAVSVIGILR